MDLTHGGSQVLFPLIFNNRGPSTLSLGLGCGCEGVSCPVQGQNLGKQSLTQAVAPPGACAIPAATGKCPGGPEEKEHGLNPGSGLVCLDAQLSLQTDSPGM